MKKYYAIYKDTKNKILAGEYKAGERLPSKRVMGDRCGVSVITVEKAYGCLVDEGYVSSSERRGYFVLPIEAAVSFSTTDTKNVVYVKDDNIENRQEFEYSVWFKTVRKVITEYADRLFIKSPVKGCAILRNALCDYLRRYRGMTAQPNNIIIGSGAEQLYEIVVKILGRDKIYGIEDPSYEQIYSVYSAMGVGIQPLKMGKNGIERSALNCGAFDVLHVTPFHSFPSGVTTSASKRHEYLGWAQKTGNYIVEDDFDSEFFIPGNPIESLYSLDVSDSVIYINTFSKSLSSSMRIGYMILPDNLLEKYDSLFDKLSCSVPVLDQYILAEFIKSGSFERHLNKMRKKMRNQETT